MRVKVPIYAMGISCGWFSRGVISVRRRAPLVAAAIPAVEVVADFPIYEEKLVVTDDAAALPYGQIAAEAVALQRLAHLDTQYRSP